MTGSPLAKRQAGYCHQMHHGLPIWLWTNGAAADLLMFYFCAGFRSADRTAVFGIQRCPYGD
jgi:hypothetical protein